MKTKLFFLLSCFTLLIQAQEVTISGDVMLCPYTNGTATVNGDQTYDTYQWYYKYWFLDDAYVAIDGATSASFTYDWMTYDQALLKVYVTSGSDIYESNSIQIDSYAWASMDVGLDVGDNVTFDPDTETFQLCEGTTLAAQIFMPYDTDIQWYNNGVPITGANNMTYAISAAGEYTVKAAPSFCPDSSSTSLPIAVSMTTDCALGLPANALSQIKAYPVPASSFVNLSGLQGNVAATLFDMKGSMVRKQEVTDGRFSLEGLPAGIYVLKITDGTVVKNLKVIKQ